MCNCGVRVLRSSTHNMMYLKHSRGSSQDEHHYMFLLNSLFTIDLPDLDWIIIIQDFHIPLQCYMQFIFKLRNLNDLVALSFLNCLVLFFR